MSKETFYFSHDYNSRSDEKIKRLIRKHGMAGYGIFWSIVEDLYNNENDLQADYDDIAYDLRSDSKLIRSVICDFGLFIIENGCFGSDSVQRRLEQREEKSEKARQKAFKRWGTDTVSDANVSDNDATALKNNATASESDATALKNDAIKERKGYKGKESIKKEPENPSPSELDFIQLIIEEFKKVFPDYVITTPGKEKASAGKLLAVFKKQYPVLSSEEMLKKLRGHFDTCKGIGDKWYKANMSLSLMVSKYNEINNILNKPSALKPGTSVDLSEVDTENYLNAQ